DSVFGPDPDVPQNDPELFGESLGALNDAMIGAMGGGHADVSGIKAALTVAPTRPIIHVANSGPIYGSGDSSRYNNARSYDQNTWGYDHSFDPVNGPGTDSGMADVPYDEAINFLKQIKDHCGGVIKHGY